MRHGTAIAGFRLGILCIDTCHPLVPGNVQHAESFSFPVCYEVVRGVSPRALMEGDERSVPAIVDAAKRLEASGVSAIVGACGSFANFQREVAQALTVPVFMSILLEVPFVLSALPPQQQLGVIFARVSSYTDRVRRQCDIREPERVVAIGAEVLPAFQPILDQAGDLNSPALESELIGLARQSLAAHPAIGAWLIQCSDLPPYAASLRRATGLPVFDMVTLIEHIGTALRPREFAGQL